MEDKAQELKAIELRDEWVTDPERCNQWYTCLADFTDLLEQSGAFWCVDMQLKYLNIRVDTRTGHFFITADDVEGRITPSRVIDAINKWQGKTGKAGLNQTRPDNTGRADAIADNLLQGHLAKDVK